MGGHWENIPWASNQAGSIEKFHQQRSRLDLVFLGLVLRHRDKDRKQFSLRLKGTECYLSR